MGRNTENNTQTGTSICQIYLEKKKNHQLPRHKMTKPKLTSTAITAKLKKHTQSSKMPPFWNFWIIPCQLGMNIIRFSFDFLYPISQTFSMIQHCMHKYTYAHSKRQQISHSISSQEIKEGTKFVSDFQVECIVSTEDPGDIGHERNGRRVSLQQWGSTRGSMATKVMRLNGRVGRIKRSVHWYNIG